MKFQSTFSEKKKKTMSADNIITTHSLATSSVAQNAVRFILRMRKVSSGHLLSIDTNYNVSCFCERTAKALIRLRVRAVWYGPSLSVYAQRHFLHGMTHFISFRGEGRLRPIRKDRIFECMSSAQYCTSVLLLTSHTGRDSQAGAPWAGHTRM